MILHCWPSSSHSGLGSTHHIWTSLSCRARRAQGYLSCWPFPTQPRVHCLSILLMESAQFYLGWAEVTFCLQLLSDITIIITSQTAFQYFFGTKKAILFYFILFYFILLFFNWFFWLKFRFLLRWFSYWMLSERSSWKPKEGKNTNRNEDVLIFRNQK